MKKIKIYVTVALILALGWSICPTEGFIPNELLALGSKVLSPSTEDAITHPEMTRKAILEVAAEVFGR